MLESNGRFRQVLVLVRQVSEMLGGGLYFLITKPGDVSNSNFDCMLYGGGKGSKDLEDLKGGKDLKAVQSILLEGG